MRKKEELLAKRDALKAAVEEKAIEKEIAELEAQGEEKKEESKVEVKTDEVRITRDMKKAAEEGNFEKFSAQWAEKVAMETSKAMSKQLEKESNRKVYIPQEIVKSFGSQGDQVKALAEDIAQLLPKMDAVTHLTKGHIADLKIFRRNFGKQPRELVDAAVKALTSTGSGTGDEYVPTIFSDVLQERLKNVSPELGVLNVIDVPSVPYRIPIYTATPTTYYATEGSTIAASDPTTSNLDLDPKKLGNLVKYSGELEEDSILAILPFVQMVMMESLMDQVSRAICFGDTRTSANTNINLIDGTPTTTAGGADAYTAFNGLVYNALIASNGKNTDVNSSLVSTLATVMQKMGVGGIQGDVVWLSNVELTYKLMADSNFLTVDKAGQYATLYKGMAGLLYGAPVIATSGLPKTNSAGKIPAAGGTLGSILAVKKSGVLVGFKRRPQIKDSDILQASDQRQFVATTRLDLKVIQPNATDRAAVSYGFNAAL